MLHTRAGRLALIVGTLSLFSGCQQLGPIAIEQGRDRYNHTIESTAKEQTLANIIRVYHHEPTLFMDVTEIDATTTVSGNASGGATGIGARAGTSGGTLAGEVGSFSTGVTYSESPLIRYQPLLGQALVVQLATPVSTDAIASLYDSSWDLPPLLDFVTSYFTPDDDDLYAALNILSELNTDGSVEVVSEKSQITKTKDSTRQQPLTNNSTGGNVTLEVTNKAGGDSGGSGDSLVVYFMSSEYRKKGARKEKSETKNDQYLHDRRLWEEFHQLYVSAQTQGCEPAGNKQQHSTKSDLVRGDGNKNPGSAAANKKSDNKHSSQVKCSPPPYQVELRTTPVVPEKANKYGLESGAPLMKTYSALGILKNATEPPHPKIEFVNPEQYRTIRSYLWNTQSYLAHISEQELSFYTLLPSDEHDGEDPVIDRKKNDDLQTTNEVVQWLQTHQNPFMYKEPNRISWGDFSKGNQKMGYLRRYILIVHSAVPPINPYVSYFIRGEWYYIARDDEISQKNFNLISLFMTMMAVPSATPALAPTIAVGGGM